MRLIDSYKKYIQCVLFTLVIGLTSLSSAEETSTANILVVGDSLSSAYGIDIKQGWVHLLQQRLDLKHHFRVINASITGDTTQGGLKRLPSLLQEYSPVLVIIELGGNDGLRGYPLTKMRENITQMIELSRTNNAKVLLLGIRIPPNYGRRYSEGFFNSYANIAAETQTALVPIFMAGVDENLDAMQSDGIHPNASAQPQLLENVWPHLYELIDIQ